MLIFFCHGGWAELAILTARPERRIKALEGDVKALPERDSSTETRLEIAVKLQLISSLIIRSEQAMRELLTFKILFFCLSNNTKATS